MRELDGKKLEEVRVQVKRKYKVVEEASRATGRQDVCDCV